MRIYVGNLSYEVTEQELQQAFQAHGKVDSVTMVMDRYTGRSKGFAFVEMPTNAEAQKAITALNGTVLRERTLTVNEARPRTERDYRGGGGGGSDRGYSSGYSGRGRR